MKTKIAYLLLYVLAGSVSAAYAGSESRLISDSGKNAYGHYLTRDQDNNPVISWIEEEPSSGKNHMVFAISYDQGNTFSAPVKVPGTEGCTDGHGEGAPKIAFKQDGSVVAVFAKRKPTAQNRFAGTIEYVISADKGKSWTKARNIHSDEEGNSHAFHDVAVLPDGEIGVIWLDTRNAGSETGSELYWAKTAPGKGFGRDYRIAANTCQCCRTRLYVAADGRVCALYRGLLQDGCRDILLITSRDGGLTFANPVCISNDKWMIKGCPHAGPDIAESEGVMYFTWFTGASEAGIYYTFSGDRGKTFQQRRLVSGEARHAHIASLSDQKVFLSWSEPVKYKGAYYNRVFLKNVASSGKAAFALSEEASDTMHPILLAVDSNSMLVAWLERDGELYKLKYRTVKV